jgi:hypothetical protein
MNTTLNSNTFRRLNVLLFVLFAVFLALFEFRYHEFWKDEWQAWFIATDTSIHSFWDLLPGEGHPMLWFLLLRMANGTASLLFSSIAPELIIQLAHLSCALGAAWLFFRYFRFHPALKALIAPGYFFFFEYGIVNRGYILVILLLFALVPCLEQPGRSRRILPVILFLLTQTEIYGLFAAFAVGIYIGITTKRTGTTRTYIFSILPLGVSLFLGLLLFLATLVPPETVHTEGAGIGEAFTAVCSHTLAIAFDPPVSASAGPGFFSASFSLLLLACMYLVLRKNRFWLITYAFFFLLFLLFHAFVYRGGPRQWGLHFVFLVFVLNFNVASRKEALRFAAFGVLLAVAIPAQLLYGIRILEKEKQYVFSNARDAGIYIREHIAADLPIIGINKAYCTPVIGYSQHKFYSMPGGELFSYAIFREKMYLPGSSDLEAFYRAKGKGGAMYVLSYRPLPARSFPKLQRLASFDKPSIREESYFLYLYTP